jgi:hypothetical protein
MLEALAVPHVELGRHAELNGPLEVLAHESVRVGVDEAGACQGVLTGALTEAG